jgi:uncharacterized protein (DUF885 family)
MPRSFASLALVAFALSAAPLAARADAVADLHALFDREWERDLADNPLAATYLGDPRYNDRLPDISPSAEDARAAADARVLEELARIPRKSLPPAEQLNYDLFRHEYETRMAARPFHPEHYSIEASGGPQSLNELAELVPFETVADYETWLRRVQAIPAYLDQYGDRLRRGATEKRTQPRAVMERVLEPLAKQVAEKPEDSPFFERFRSYPNAIAQADRDRLDAEAKRVIGESVVPAYRRFQAVFRDEYLPATRDSVGLWDTPDGREYYRFLARYHTTTALTPEEIHAIGLKEVARNRSEMQKVMDEVGFKGSLTDFFQHLRTDPQFYYRTGDELFRAYAYIVKMIDPELPRLFGSRPGYYYVNLYRPEVRPKYEMEVLSVHEAAPGHHLQIALAQEQTDMPAFRRAGGFTAYIEGWGLYSERLGYDLGLYKDPYSRFGQLTYDQWRAVRLVVDTGLHDMQWTRQQAIDYFIVNEIDRYISNPGQALAYKVGQLKLLELRARAEQALGGRFDIRAFHDTVLATGPVPLDILERTVDGWLAAQKAK